jgi:hypothetical protein
MLNGLIHNILWGLTESLPSRTRDIKREGNLYLRRFYLTPRRLEKTGAEASNGYLGFGIYLHYFYRGDEDKELHNHPWKSATSLILSGGYMEERRCNETNIVHTKLIRPMTLNHIGANDFHRITLLDSKKHVWTLFFTFSRSQDWGFWDPYSNSYTPHKQFINQIDQGYLDCLSKQRKVEL